MSAPIRCSEVIFSSLVTAFAVVSSPVTPKHAGSRAGCWFAGCTPWGGNALRLCGGCSWSLSGCYVCSAGPNLWVLFLFWGNGTSDLPKIKKKSPGTLFPVWIHWIQRVLYASSVLPWDLLAMQSPAPHPFLRQKSSLNPAKNSD